MAWAPERADEVLQGGAVRGFSFPYDFHSNFLLFLDFFIIRIQYVIHVTYKICVYQLFMLPVRLLVYSGLLVAKFGGSQKLYIGF